MPVNNDASQSHSLDELGSGGFSLPPHLEVIPNGSSGNITNMANIKVGKKKGTDYRCESCSKASYFSLNFRCFLTGFVSNQIYRHPSCLIKHRWEHTPHWHEASKFVLSKHQQVQLLEVRSVYLSQVAWVDDAYRRLPSYPTYRPRRPPGHLCPKTGPSGPHSFQGVLYHCPLGR
jgi:hypothetical protein